MPLYGLRTAQVRLGLALGGAIHAELLELAGEGIAPPAEKPRGLLAMAPRAPERRADQYALELGLRVSEERPLGCERAPIGPALERGGPVAVLGRTRRGAGELLREVAHVYFDPGGEHREPPTEVHELADVPRPLVRGEPREGLGGEQLRLDAELVRGDQKIVGEEVGDVLGARAERRQLDQDHVEDRKSVV